MQKDITQGKPGREWTQILLFSIPILLGNLLQQLYNTVDGIVVGNFVSEASLAAIGSCAELAMVFLAIAVGMSNGSAILIAQLFGAKQLDKLRRAESTILILLLVIGVVMTLFGFFCARWLLRYILNITVEEVLDLAVIYFRIYALGLLFQYMYNCVAAILRAIGDSRATLYFLLVTVVMNLFLDLLFVIVFHWGIAGAAAATVIAQVVCVTVSIIYMFKKYELLRLDRKSFVFDGAMCRTGLKMGVPTTIQQGIISFGNVFMQRLVNTFGQPTMSAFFVGGRIMSIIFMPCLSFNIGMATFTGQNVGAGKYDRVKRGLRGIIVCGVVICLVLGTIAYLFAPKIAALFGVQGESLRQSAEYMRVIAFLVWLMACYMPITATLQGSGDIMMSTVCTVGCFAVRLASAHIMAALGVGCMSIWVSQPISWLAALIIGGIRYGSGKWKTKALVKRGEEESG